MKLYSFDLQLFASEEKTEEPTPKKKRDVRKKGEVAKSKDLSAAVNLVAMVMLFSFGSHYIMEKICSMLEGFYADFLSLSVGKDEVSVLTIKFISEFFVIISPIFVVALISGLIINYFQVGFLIAPEALKFKPERLNPIEGFKRIVSKKALVELSKSLVKIVMVGAVSYIFISGQIETLVEILYMDATKGYKEIISLFVALSVRVSAIFLVVAVLDYVFQRYEFQERIKMSKKEVKDEHRQTEGDPHLRAKLKEKQKEFSVNRMIKEVPDSTIVITNPTRLAIALKYEHKMHAAPVITAIGAGFLAERVREIAEENEVPIIENKPVAQAIYRKCEVGDEVPVELYQAVAEILAVVLKMKK